jgi:BioD-like phosphotransacetylase family protein
VTLLGVLPVKPLLSNPTLGMVLDGVHGETINPGPDLDRVIDGVAIGAMEPGHMLERVVPGTL